MCMKRIDRKIPSHTNFFLLGGESGLLTFYTKALVQVTWQIRGTAYLAGVVTALKSLNPNFLLT